MEGLCLYSCPRPCIFYNDSKVKTSRPFQSLIIYLMWPLRASSTPNLEFVSPTQNWRTMQRQPPTPQLTGIGFKPLLAKLQLRAGEGTLLRGVVYNTGVHSKSEEWEGHAPGPKANGDDVGTHSAALAWEPTTTDPHRSPLLVPLLTLYSSWMDRPCWRQPLLLCFLEGQTP